MLRQAKLFAAVLAMTVLSKPAAAQVGNIDSGSCRVVEIKPSPYADMTKRLNENEDCLWGLVRKLDQDASDLKDRINNESSNRDKLAQTFKGQATTNASVLTEMQNIEANIASLTKKLDVEIAERKALAASTSQNNSGDSAASDIVHEITSRLDDLQARLAMQTTLVAQLRAEIKNRPRLGKPDNSNDVYGLSQGGLEIRPENAFITQDREHITANFSLRNATNGKMLLLVISPESGFIIDDINDPAKILSQGITYCSDQTESCTRVNESSWSTLLPGQVAPLKLTSWLPEKTQSKTVRAKVRFLIKKSESSEHYDFTIPPLNLVSP